MKGIESEVHYYLADPTKVTSSPHLAIVNPLEVPCFYLEANRDAKSN